jgi:RNA polymerase sigma-70 factor (ECF subfamily)
MGSTADEVYEELAPAVLGYFRSRGARHPEDLAGDVFVSVAERLSEFRGDAAALRRWVFTIAHHRLVDEYRRAERQRETVMAEVPDREPAPSADRDVGLEVGLDVELLGALAELTEEQREVVVLRYVADLSLRDVARILGKRSGAVKMLQARGLDALQAALDARDAGNA